MNQKIKYQFSAKLWRHSSKGGWYFITMPEPLAAEIRSNLQWQEEGWGRMKATIEISSLEWKTSIWFDTKADSYIIPVKSEIRTKLALETGDEISVSVYV